MTYYLGSKANHADEILKIVLAKRRSNQTYVEPFLGGANVLCRVPQADGPRIGADINPYMIALHQALADGWDPPESMDEVTYAKIKKNPKKFPPELVGFAGTVCSFSSKWFDAYAGEYKQTKTSGKIVNRCGDGRKNALNDAPGLKGATFVCSSYEQLDFPPQSLIYCDIPYLGTTGYVSGDQDKWRAYKFWQWADRMVEEDHTVFVSEYTGPSSEVYPMPPRTPEHTAALDRCRKLQADMVALGDAPVPDEMRIAFENAAADIADHDAKRILACRALADRWKVVWSKKVSVGVDVTAKTETEKLFHREA